MTHYLLTLLTVMLCFAPAEGSEPDRKDPKTSSATRVDAKASKHRGEEILGPGLGEFIFIAGGEFTMGRNNGENEDEKPEHRVELSSFYVGKTPVTAAQLVRFMNEVRIEPKEYLSSQVSWASTGVTFRSGIWSCERGKENIAACGESWVFAQRYCDWLSKKSGRKCRLPTEAEWEYVCRGKECRTFPWGNDMSNIDSKVWGWRCSTTSTKVPVGRFPKGATPEGVSDMVGYMDEMCSDWYDPLYYAKSPKRNPQGPSQRLEEEVKRGRNARVTRGGLEVRYRSKGLVGFFRESQFFGVLPSTYLPRGWSRRRVNELADPPQKPSFVSGRLGFRVVVEPKSPNDPNAKH